MRTKRIYNLIVFLLCATVPFSAVTQPAFALRPIAHKISATESSIIDHQPVTISNVKASSSGANNVHVDKTEIDDLRKQIEELEGQLKLASGKGKRKISKNLKQKQAQLQEKKMYLFKSRRRAVLKGIVAVAGTVAIGNLGFFLFDKFTKRKTPVITGIYLLHDSSESFNEMKKYFEEAFEDAQKNGRKIYFIQEQAPGYLATIKLVFPKLHDINIKDIFSENSDSVKLKRIEKTFMEFHKLNWMAIRKMKGVFSNKNQYLFKELLNFFSQMDKEFSVELYKYLYTRWTEIGEYYVEGEAYLEKLFEVFLKFGRSNYISTNACRDLVEGRKNLSTCLKEYEKGCKLNVQAHCERDIAFSDEVERIKKQALLNNADVMFFRGIAHHRLGVISKKINKDFNVHIQTGDLLPHVEYFLSLAPGVKIDDTKRRELMLKSILCDVLDIIYTYTLHKKDIRALSIDEMLTDIMKNLDAEDVEGLLKAMPAYYRQAEVTGTYLDVYIFNHIFKAKPELKKYQALIKKIRAKYKRRQNRGAKSLQLKSYSSAKSSPAGLKEQLQEYSAQYIGIEAGHHNISSKILSIAAVSAITNAVRSAA